MLNPSVLAAAMTLSRVSGRTVSGWENVRETVAVDTPALNATSLMVIGMGTPSRWATL